MRIVQQQEAGYSSKRFGYVISGASSPWMWSWMI
jgi:hypothetical protein